MLKLMANKVLAFTQGEKDAKGRLIKVKTKVGFCTLPDWVEQDDYYKLAISDGSITSFTASADDENVLKAQQRLAALKEEIKALEEKKESLVAPAATAPASTATVSAPVMAETLAEKIDAKDVEKIESIDAELEARKEEVRGVKKPT
jgi:hypothetical protein